MNVSREWVAQQAAKATAPVREGWSDGALTVFVPGRPRNPLNSSHGHWTKHARWAKTWRERTSMAFWRRAPLYSASLGTRVFHWLAEDPKRVTFTVYGPARFDDDNLRAVCKPARDSLKDMRVIDDDRDSAGHVFVYEQAPPTRKAGSVHGIAIRIEVQR